MLTAAQILDSRRTPESWAGWVPTFIGQGYRPWSDNPGTLTSMDLSYGLAHTYRYGGQSVPGITVAEHCVFVSSIIERLWPQHPRLWELVRAGLLHDAAEAVLHDIQGPLRGMVKVHLPNGEILGWDDSDKRVSAVIAGTFGVRSEDLFSDEVRAADLLAVCFEQRQCTNLLGDWGLPDIPAEIDDMKLDFLGPRDACMKFFDRMSEIVMRV